MLGGGALIGKESERRVRGNLVPRPPPFLFFGLHAFSIFGASLSEPHTSVTALLDPCVCMYVCLFACGHILKILIERTDTYISNLDTCAC